MFGGEVGGFFDSVLKSFSSCVCVRNKDVEIAWLLAFGECSCRCCIAQYLVSFMTSVERRTLVRSVCWE